MQDTTLLHTFGMFQFQCTTLLNCFLVIHGSRAKIYFARFAPEKESAMNCPDMTGQIAFIEKSLVTYSTFFGLVIPSLGRLSTDSGHFLGRRNIFFNRTLGELDHVYFAYFDW